MHCYFLIPHALERQILLVQNTEGFSLPRWTLPATWAGRPTHEHQRALLLNQAVHKQFGLATAVLLTTPLNSGHLVIFDTLSLSHLPLLAGRWINAGELASLQLADLDQRAVLEAWFAEEETAREERMPWQKRGWFGTTAARITSQLNQHDWSLLKPVEQLYTKYGACMLRACTTSGTVYLKALPPSFAREPRLVSYLSQHFPRSVPRVLAIDEARNWLLMREAPGRLLYDLTDVKAWEHALCTLAILQIACVSRREELLAAGFRKHWSTATSTR